MTDTDQLFSFLVHATAGDDHSDRTPGARHALIVIVRAVAMMEAKLAARAALTEARWEFPDVKEAIQIDPKMRVSRVPELEDSMRAAATHGHAIVVFKEPIPKP